MALSGFSVGRDVSLDIIDTSGNPLDFGLMTSFKHKKDQVDVKVKPIGGGTIHITIPDGYSGSFTYERRNGNADDYFCRMDDNYYAGRDQPTITFTETVQEPDGSISQYRYIGVVLSYQDAGEWKGDATVKQVINWFASKKIKIQ